MSQDDTTPKETSPAISTEGPSLQKPWSAEEWWAEKTKLSRLRNLTPEQRRSRASSLRLFRRAKWDETLELRR